MPEWEPVGDIAVRPEQITDFFGLEDTLKRDKAYQERVAAKGQGTTSATELFLKDMSVLEDLKRVEKDQVPQKKRKKLDLEQKKSLERLAELGKFIKRENNGEEETFVIDDRYPPQVLAVWRNINRGMKSGARFANDPTVARYVREYHARGETRLSSSESQQVAELGSQFQKDMVSTCISMYENIYVIDKSTGKPDRNATMQTIETILNRMLQGIPQLHRQELAQRQQAILAEFSTYVYYTEKGYKVTLTKPGQEDQTGVDFIAEKDGEVIYIDTKTGDNLREYRLPVLSRDKRRRVVTAQSIAITAENNGMPSKHNRSAINIMENATEEGMPGRPAPTALAIVTMPPNQFKK
jgi:hypothetical protein